MKQLSFWAKNHRWQSWILITALHVGLLYLAIYSSSLLFLEGIVLPFSIWYISLGAVLAAFLFYPIRGKKKGVFKNNYTNRKRFDFLVVLSGFFMTLTLFSQLTLVNHEEARKSATSPRVQNVLLVPQAKKESVKTKFKRWVKKRHDRRTKRIQKYWKKYSSGEKVLFIILTLLAAFVLFYAVILLGCSLACSGAEALGNLVIAGGTIAIIVGLFFAIRAIVRHESKPKPSTS